MSYILDALRKADAQRERDPSRGIHAHPAPLGGSMARPGGTAPWWMAVAVAVVVALVAAWYAMHRNPAAVSPAPVVQAPPPPLAQPAPAPQPAPPPPRVAVANEISPPPARTPSPPQPNLVPRMGGMPPPPRGAPQVAPQAAPPQPAPQARAPQQPVTPPPAAPAPTVSGLPPDAPKVAISGGVYSPNPAQRMLIVNGQVFNEGSEVAAGLVIEKIEPRTATLKFRGALYTVAY